ncbi:MAG TPA: threonine synthase [Anaerolinea sp.]|nr:threonine synthase [Anaerolinea sp.]
MDLVDPPPFQKDRVDPTKPGMWRYAHNLPVAWEAAISMGEGFSPLISLPFAGKDVLIKQDHLAPTGSYKDRGASVLISQVKALGIRHVVEDSSGNAGCAVAAYCANAGITCDIYVPENTSPAKLTQIEWYGARLVKVPGSREDTARAVLDAAQHYYYASHSWNPFFFQGTKTFAYEVCEQLGWRAPDWVVLPAGNGTLLLGAAIGFRELFEAGVIGGIPKICAIQAGNCAPLAAAFLNVADEVARIVPSETLAEGIAIANPIRARQILDAVRVSQGNFITVSETEIREALVEMGEKGYFIEPTSAATIAGVKKLARELPGEAVVVTTFTGHGLKAAEKLHKIRP